MSDDVIVEALIDMREALFLMVNNHNICFENDSDNCVYPRLEEAAELIDEVILYRSPDEARRGWDAEGKMHREQDLATNDTN